MGIFATHPAAPTETDWDVVVGVARAVLNAIDKVLDSNPASEPKGAVGSTGHWWDGHDGVFRTGTPGTVRTEQN